MRKLLIAAVIALVGIMPMSAMAQTQGQAQTETYSYADDWFYPLFLGAGAVAGVVVINLLTSGYVGNIPYYTGMSSAVETADMTATALSRVWAVTGVVIGGWVANWLYTGM